MGISGLVVFFDITPKLFPHNQGIADLLISYQVFLDEYPKCILAGTGMSLVWRARKLTSIL